MYPAKQKHKTNPNQTQNKQRKTKPTPQAKRGPYYAENDG